MSKPIFRIKAVKKDDSSKKYTVGTLWQGRFGAGLNLSWVTEPKEEYNEISINDLNIRDYFFNVYPTGGEDVEEYGRLLTAEPGFKPKKDAEAEEDSF